MAIREALRCARRHRRGIAALVFGLTLPVFIGFATLSVDTAVLAVARSQLSTAADSAALAGARQLADENRVRGATDLTSEISAANSHASTIAAANFALNQSVLVNQNTSNSTGGDVLVGYLDTKNSQSTLVTNAAFTSLFNSVQVTAQRTSDHVGLVPTFFGALMGYRGSNVQVQSTATVQNYSISGFKSVNNQNVNLLPIVLDLTTYQTMLAGTQGGAAGTASDQYTYNPTTNTVTDGPDGVAESKLYPVASGSPGNWGTIKVGVTNNSTSVLSSQITNGITPSQLATFPGGVIQLDSSQTPPSIIFSGNPGISAGISSALQSIIGKPVSIPIYDLNDDNGNNAWYRVIAFAAVRIMSVDFQGNPKYVIVQPALVTDPNAVRGAAQSSWTSGGVIGLFLSR